MSTNSIQDLLSESLPDAIESSNLALTHIKISFLIGVGVFIILAYFCKSRKSYFDAVAARKVISFARLFIFVELLCIFILYYFYFEHGPLMDLHQYLGYGNGDSWLYTYGRPTAGVVFIGVGMVAEMHPAPRYLCMVGCLVEMFGDALSAFQVRDYYNQVRYHSAPRNGYSDSEILAYFYRDVVSLGLCTVVLLLMALLAVQVGLCEPQLIHASQISGKELDRYAAMRENKENRQIMAMEGLLGPQKERTGLGLTKARIFTKTLAENHNSKLSKAAAAGTAGTASPAAEHVGSARHLSDADEV